MRKYPIVCEIHLRLYDWMGRKRAEENWSYRRERKEKNGGDSGRVKGIRGNWKVDKETGQGSKF
jgi:hypothetical protein